MNLLQRKIDMNRRSDSGAEDPRLAGSALAAIKVAIPAWMGEEGWAVARSGSRWIKSASLTADMAPSGLHLYREEGSVLMVGVSSQTALRASAFALGSNPDQDNRRVGAFERHHGKTLTEKVWNALTEQPIDFEDGVWSFVETVSPVPFANGPEQLLCLDVTLAREDTEGDFKLVLFAQAIPLPEVDILPDSDTEEAEDDEVDIDLDIDDLKDRLGPCRLSVHVVGDQLDLSVADCTRLEIGQVFNLPRLQFDDVALRLVSGGRMRELSRGTLGMDSGRKAVKLHRPPDPDFFAQAADFVDEPGADTGAQPTRVRPGQRPAQRATA